MTKNTLLAVLQQAEYDLNYFNKWYDKNGKKIKLAENNTLKLKWTLKLKLISVLYELLFFLKIKLKFKIILWLLSPIEILIRQIIYKLAIFKLSLLKLTGLKVVAIAGSFGKTSTKQLLNFSLGQQTPTLVTPQSVNTPLGIARVILSKLKFQHKIFIVELGEYYPKDIKRLCKFIKPEFGILTPIGRQHLERMESFENIIKTFGELIEFFKHNLNNLVVAQQNLEYYPKFNLVSYGLKTKNSQPNYAASNIKVSRAGTEFAALLKNKDLKIFLSLFGEHQANNLLPAFFLAEKLNLDLNKLAASFAQMPSIPHRHEATFGENNLLILDNGYNSNPDSVSASLKLLNQLNEGKRILITPGFLELGEKAKQIHVNFGKQLVGQVDYLGLINFPNTKDIILGFSKNGGKKSQIYVGETQEDLVKQMQSKFTKGSVILFENGVNEVYR